MADDEDRGWMDAAPADKEGETEAVVSVFCVSVSVCPCPAHTYPLPQRVADVVDSFIGRPAPFHHNQAKKDGGDEASEGGAERSSKRSKRSRCVCVCVCGAMVHVMDEPCFGFEGSGESEVMTVRGCWGRA